MSDITKTGFLNSAELKEAGRYPSEERLKKGPVAVIECCQNIPCNPCETACKFGAITVGDLITNLPVLDESKCVGCGVCLTKCPGLAIFVVDKSKDMATVSFPFEYLPLPEKGDIVILTKDSFMTSPIVKRVIATEGDTVDIDFETGEVSVNGEVLDETYIAEKTQTHFDMDFPQTVPEGCIFVMGDNRNHSTDSRCEALGMVDTRYVIGKVLMRIYPLNEIGTVS